MARLYVVAFSKNRQQRDAPLRLQPRLALWARPSGSIPSPVQLSSLENEPALDGAQGDP
jgi:hypothetical protein